ncbi:hypothetical protein ABBQ32_000723 [Trebouxia sp. C0010 RCD-2024]
MFLSHASKKALNATHQPSVSSRRSNLGVTTTTGLQSFTEEEFEVQEILTHKPKGRKKTYPKVNFLVKGQGYEHENNTWEPYKNLKNAPAALQEYWDRVAVRATQQADASKRGSNCDGYMALVSKRLRKR